MHGVVCRKQPVYVLWHFNEFMVLKCGVNRQYPVPCSLGLELPQESMIVGSSVHVHIAIGRQFALHPTNKVYA